MRELKSNDCKGTCDWKRAAAPDDTLDGQPLFECGSCGSEWVPSEGWTPRNADGEVAPEVQAARDDAGRTSSFKSDKGDDAKGSAGSW